MAHTPGPWQAECASANGRAVEWFVRRDGDDVSIACDICDPTTEAHTISEENARLIAAAPELLEALKLLLSLDDAHQRGDDDCDVCAEVQAARNAIAKATGDAR